MILTLISFLMLPSASADSKQCQVYFNQFLSVIRAPQKTTPRTPPSKLAEEIGFFPDQAQLVPTRVTTPDEQVVEHMLPDQITFKILPDANTPLGRFAESLNRKGTPVYLMDGLHMPDGVNGYFKPNAVYSPLNAETLSFNKPEVGNAIVLNRNSLNTKDFHVTAMHEAFHAFSERLRSKGIQSRFNSYFSVVDEAQDLLSPYQIYSKKMHSDEVHTYTKEFIHQSVVAHHRETLFEIEAQLKKMPSHFTREQKLRQIKIDYDTVIHSGDYNYSFVNVSNIVKSHEANVNHIREHLQKYLKSKPDSQLKFSRTADDRLVLSTDRVHFVLNDINIYQMKVSKNGTLDLKPALKKIDELIAMDQSIQQQLKKTASNINAAQKLNYFTGESYLRMKNDLADLAKLVKVEVPLNPLPVQTLKLNAGPSIFGMNYMPGLRNWFKKSDEVLLAPAKEELIIKNSASETRSVELTDKGPEDLTVSSKPMNQVLPGNSDHLSKVSARLAKQGASLVTYKNRFGPKGAFVDLKVKGSTQNSNGVIILNSSNSKVNDARAVLGHEAYHARMQTKRTRGETDPFNSEFISNSQKGGFYDQYLSSEEIHAWSKEFQQASVKAHHRRTLQLIQESAAQNKPVRLKYSSVIADDYPQLRQEYQMLLEAHDRFVNDVYSRLKSGEFKLKFDELNKVIIETDQYTYKPGNFSKLSSGTADIWKIEKEVDQLVRTNRQLTNQLIEIDQLMEKCKKQGYFTPDDYLQLKNGMSRFGSAVTTVVR